MVTPTRASRTRERASPPLPDTWDGVRPWPVVSVVVAASDDPATLTAALDSIARQRYPRVETLVVGRASAPRALPGITFLDVVSTVEGLSAAGGELITWLGVGERLAPGAIAAVALAFASGDADVVAGIDEGFEDGELTRRWLTRHPGGPLSIDDWLQAPGGFEARQLECQPRPFFARDVWRRCRHDVRSAPASPLEWEVWLAFARQGARLKVVGRPILRRPVPRPSDVTDVLGLLRGAPGDPSLLRERPPRRLVFVNDLGFHSGAGIAHERLARAFALAGHDVQAVAAADGSPEIVGPLITPELVRTSVEELRPDMVVVGNLHGASLGIDVVDALSERWPTVLVAHDQWSITGRCAYTGPCTGYLTGCDERCPTADQAPALAPALIRPAWEARQRLYRSGRRLALFGNSRWSATTAARALDRGDGDRRPLVPIQPIRYGLPLDVFRPRDRQRSRKRLGLPDDRFLILTSATRTGDRRKGRADLAAALEILGRPDVTCVTLGYDDAKEALPGAVSLGYVHDARRLALAYAAADLFVGPSLEEAFGQVFIEAAACGTPSVGYPIGGIPEAIRDGVTGRLAAAATPAALAAAIAELYEDGELRRRLSVLAPIHVRNEFSLEASCHTLHAALWRAGSEDGAGLAGSIRLTNERPPPPPVRLIAAGPLTWRATGGFFGWEGPYPERQIPRCRWALGPVSRIAFDVPSAGWYAVSIRCRNWWPGQRLRLVRQRQILGEFAIPIAAATDHVVEQKVELPAGTAEIELDHWQWSPGEWPPVALLITAIDVVPCTPPPPPRRRSLLERGARRMLRVARAGWRRARRRPA
jgi:glycosyltransferase involved in cell wall biosynthesis